MVTINMQKWGAQRESWCDSEFRFKPGTDGAALLAETMKKRLPSVTRGLDGCEFVHLYADPHNANHLSLLERWESRAKYGKYREWAMAQPGRNDALSLLDRDPVYTYLDDTGA